jgi:hypothetical protein
MTIATRPPRGRVGLADLVAAALALAGGIHLAVGLDHGITDHGLTGHGALFAAAGVVQLALAAVVARRAAPWALGAAVATSLLLVGAWASTRAPIAADPDPVALLDAATVALQAAAGLAGLALLRRPIPTPRRLVPALPVLALMALLGLAGGLVGPSAHDHHDHDHGDGHEHPVEAPVAAQAEAEPRPDLFGDLFTAHTDGTHGHATHTGAEPESSAEPGGENELSHDHEPPHDH